jgi:hypothetical protein
MLLHAIFGTAINHIQLGIPVNMRIFHDLDAPHGAVGSVKEGPADEAYVS